MEEKDLQKQQEYTFTVPRAEGQKVYHFGARRFKLLAGAVLICTVCMVGALGYMGYNFYQFRQERTDFLEYQAKKGELEAQLQSLLADNEKMLRDMSEITTLETKLRRALIRDTDSTKLGSDLSSASGETATAGNAPRYLGQGGPADLGVKEMAAVLTLSLIHILDSIQSCCFSAAGQIEFTCGSAVFGFYTHFQILLSGVGNDFA